MKKRIFTLRVDGELVAALDREATQTFGRGNTRTLLLQRILEERYQKSLESARSAEDRKSTRKPRAMAVSE